MFKIANNYIIILIFFAQFHNRGMGPGKNRHEMQKGVNRFTVTPERENVWEFWVLYWP